MVLTNSESCDMLQVTFTKEVIFKREREQRASDTFTRRLDTKTLSNSEEVGCVQPFFHGYALKERLNRT